MDAIDQLPESQRQLLMQLATRQKRFAGDIANSLAALGRVTEGNLRLAQATVARVNAAVGLAVVERLTGEDGIRDAFTWAQIADLATRQRCRTGQGWMSLADYNRIAYHSGVRIWRLDAWYLFAAAMTAMDWGPVDALARAAQKLNSIPATYRLSPIGVTRFNNTKRYRIIRLDGNSAVIDSTIFDWITPIDDYPARLFVYPIMAMIPLLAWEPYLQETIGWNAAQIIAAYGAARAANKHRFWRPADRSWVANPFDPGVVTGVALTQGLWSWWRELHLDLVARHSLPDQLQAKVVEHALQFPLIPVLDYHRRLGKTIGWPFSVSNVHESQGVVYATMPDETGQLREVAIAERRLLWRDRAGLLRAGSDRRPTHSGETGLVMLRDIPLCKSAEAGGMIFVARKGQILEAPTTEWEFEWSNPPKSLGRQLRAVGRLFWVGFRQPHRLLPALTDLFFRVSPRRAARGVAERYQVESAAVAAQVERYQSDYLRALEQGETAINDFRDHVLREFQRWSADNTYGHEARVTSFYSLFCAWLAFVNDPSSRDEAKFAAVLQQNVGTIPAGYCQDTRFTAIRQLIQRLEFMGLIHDIGKLVIPREILDAPRRLTEQERPIMQAHVRFSEMIARGLYPDPGLDRAITLAVMHHENEDGSGYHRGLRSHQIPALAKILRIVDFYDALRGPRPYRTPPTISRLETLTFLLEDALRGKIHGWLVWQFVEFVFWLRDVFRQETETTWQSYGLPSPMMEFLNDIEQPASKDAAAEDQVRDRLAKEYRESVPTALWEELLGFGS